MQGDVVTCGMMCLVLGKTMWPVIGLRRGEALAWIEALFALLMRFGLYNKVALLLRECAEGEHEESEPFYQIAQVP